MDLVKALGRIIGVALAAGLFALPASASAATFTVNDLDDVHDSEFPGPFTDGVCDASGADGCTLRAAIEEANADALHDDITIAVPGTITLSLGPMLPTQDVAITGDVGGTVVDANGTGRVFSLSGPGVVLNDLTITGGSSAGGSGAGIFDNASSLILDGVTVSGNTLSSAGGDGGAGIATTASSTLLQLTDSTVSGNTITGTSGLGGGISSQGPLTLIRSTVSGNSSTLDGGGRGGGIDMNPGSTVSLIIKNSTISGNHSGGNNVGGGGGGGIFTNNNVTSPSISGGTIAGNTTLGIGGGVRFTAPTAAVSRATMYAFNTAAEGGDNCGNVTGFSAPSSNIDTGTSCNMGTGSGNQENVLAGDLDLGALADNGGPTLTRAIGPDSAALDAAPDCGGLVDDQRGLTRAQGIDCDVGAVELEYFDLTAVVAGTGAGSVTAPGIACPGDCADSLPEGAQVGLAAAPTGGSSFTGWSGACSGTGACNVTMDAAKSVTATFAAPPATTPPSTTPPAATPPKKCKKGRKLKKGKCVKKKRKKR
jgi:hypothetical protein